MNGVGNQTKKTHIKKTALTIAMPGLMHRPQDR